MSACPPRHQANVRLPTFSAPIPALTLTPSYHPRLTGSPLSPQIHIPKTTSFQCPPGTARPCIIHMFSPPAGCSVIVLAQEGEGAACGCSDAGLSAPFSACYYLFSRLPLASLPQRPARAPAPRHLCSLIITGEPRSPACHFLRSCLAPLPHPASPGPKLLHPLRGWGLCLPAACPRLLHAAKPQAWPMPGPS